MENIVNIFQIHKQRFSWVYVESGNSEMIAFTGPNQLMLFLDYLIGFNDMISCLHYII